MSEVERERDAHERNFQRVAADLRSVYADNKRLRQAIESIKAAREDLDGTCPHCGSDQCYGVGTGAVIHCGVTGRPVLLGSADIRRLADAALEADAEATS